MVVGCPVQGQELRLDDPDASLPTENLFHHSMTDSPLLSV